MTSRNSFSEGLCTYQGSFVSSKRVGESRSRRNHIARLSLIRCSSTFLTNPAGGAGIPTCLCGQTDRQSRPCLGCLSNYISSFLTAFNLSFTTVTHSYHIYRAGGLGSSPAPLSILSCAYPCSALSSFLYPIFSSYVINMAAEVDHSKCLNMSTHQLSCHFSGELNCGIGAEGNVP